jgi:tetratricopeptide (TPR) repeat protein
VNRGLERAPGDADLLQLRSLVSFALSDYPAAARDAAAALAENQFWDWSTLRSMYRTAADYTAQYRALETQALANPNAPELWFLLAYQNLVLGNRDTARRQFARVAAVDPANALARRFSTLEPGGNAGRMTSAAPSRTVRRSPTPAVEESPRGPSRDDPFSVDLGKPASPGQPGGSAPK